ncbi:MAG: addiction module protein [Planctomycetota bacterium]|nr:addiction module protein [Planctomycetaceae bacterium]MDQ3332563.1 addiction module protein [Planctomycetota bacterium]
MDIAATLAEIQTLPVEDRLRIVDAIWDGIEDEGKSVVLTPALKQELDRRIAGYEANPDDVLSWEEVRASLQAEL